MKHTLRGAGAVAVTSAEERKISKGTVDFTKVTAEQTAVVNLQQKRERRSTLLPLPNGSKRHLLLRHTSDELHVLDLSSGHTIVARWQTHRQSVTIGKPKGHHECTPASKLSTQNFHPVPRTHAASRKGPLDGVDPPSFSAGVVDPAQSS